MIETLVEKGENPNYNNSFSKTVSNISSDDKSLALSKLKTLADDNFNFAKVVVFFLERG